MGDALPAVDLGPGESVVAIAASLPACALLDSGRVKCWGYFGVGGVGGEPGQMGASLPPLDLGADEPLSLALYGSSLCVRLAGDKATCWSFMTWDPVQALGGLGRGRDLDPSYRAAAAVADGDVVEEDGRTSHAHGLGAGSSWSREPVCSRPPRGGSLGRPELPVRAPLHASPSSPASASTARVATETLGTSG